MNGMTETLQKISCLAFDVDGTLTDGHIYVGAAGELMKAFDAKDGLAIRLAGRLGYKTALITGRQSAIVEARARELGIDAAYQGVIDKTAALRELCRQFSLKAENIAYMGDDLNDLAVMRLVGFSCAPADAAGEIKQLAGFIAGRPGGRGAAREMIEFILTARGQWQEGVGLLLNAG